MNTRQILTGAAALALTAQAQAAYARVAYICPELHGSELKVRVGSGCISTSTSYLGHDLALEVDQETATIRVTGDLKFGGGGRIQTADCMGKASVTLTASDIEPRRYSVLYDGRFLATHDMIENPRPEKCLSAGKQRATTIGAGTLRRSAYRDWNDNPVEGWPDWRAPGVLSLLGSVLNGHPETTEGRPTAQIAIAKAQWRPGILKIDKVHRRGPFIAVTITQHGFLDDSVSGARYFAEARLDENGEWKLDGFWSQTMCVRGANAGQWTAGNCP